MSIETGRMVELEYTLASPEGEVLETSEGEEPLLYVHGTGELPDSVEEALDGKDVGDSVRVDLGPDELFGAYDPGGIVQVGDGIAVPGVNCEAIVQIWANLDIAKIP